MNCPWDNIKVSMSEEMQSSGGMVAQGAAGGTRGQ